LRWLIVHPSLDSFPELEIVNSLDLVGLPGGDVARALEVGVVEKVPDVGHGPIELEKVAEPGGITSPDCFLGNVMTTRAATRSTEKSALGDQTKTRWKRYPAFRSRDKRAARARAASVVSTAKLSWRDSSSSIISSTIRAA
jgi:hypothetical protein